MANIFYEILRQVALTFFSGPEEEYVQEYEYIPNSRYTSKIKFLTRNERDFFEALYNIAGNHYYIFAQVRLADIFNAQGDDRSAYFTAFNKIAAKHVDFLLCDKDLNILTGIELDDSTHELGYRQERDYFVNELFEEAGIPLLRFLVRESYYPDEIRAAIAEVTGESTDNTTPPPLPNENRATPPPLPATNDIPICPNCLTPMVLRRSRYGRPFWGCPHFPMCRETISIKDS